MGVLSDLNSLKIESGLVITGLLLSILPGILVVFNFDCELFITLDIFKLILLAAAIGTSVAVIIFLSFSFWETDWLKKSNDKDFFAVVFMSVLLGYLALILSLFLCYFTKIGFKTFIIVVLVTSIIFSFGLSKSAIRE